MARVSTYLNFPNYTEEAFNFYTVRIRNGNLPNPVFAVLAICHLWKAFHQRVMT